jgi:fructokinase
MRPDRPAELVLGVDLGGTKIEAVLARRSDRDGAPALDVIDRRRAPTAADQGYDAVIAAAEGLVRAMTASSGVELDRLPIGFGMPGGTTRRGGLVKNSNAVCLNGRPFRADLALALGRPIAFENDANCFALAEATLGAAAAHRDGIVFGAILGTGVGGGLVVRGSIWEGAQGIAGEWGHHAVFHGGAGADRACYCGQRGCLERYCSGPAVEDDYAQRAGARLPLAEIARRRGSDPHATAAIDAFLAAFARGLANVIDILDPSAVVLGGGVSNLDVLYDDGARKVAELVFNDELTIPILRHALGDSAGVLGAALIAR